MRRVFSLFGLVLAVLLVGGIAVASIPDASGVIHGCRKNTDGSLKVIDSDLGQTCGNGYTALNWNQAIAGYEIVTNSRTMLPSDGFYSAVKVTCPIGKKVLGGGGYVGIGSTSNETSELRGSYPRDNGTAWELLVKPPTASDVPEFVFAICVT